MDRDKTHAKLTAVFESLLSHGVPADHLRELTRTGLVLMNLANGSPPERIAVAEEIATFVLDFTP